MLFSVAVSRTRRPIAALRSPSPVQAAALTAITRIKGPIADAGTSMPTIAPPTTKANTDTNIPFAITGRERPRKSGRRRAGVTRMKPSVCCCRSSVIVLLMAKMHGMAAYCSALPIT